MNSRMRYRNEVWLLLHKEDSAEKETAAVTLYLDESGGNDPNTPQAVVGGLVINRSHFLPFEECWDHMLDAHGIIPPLHMKEFTPHGRFAGMSHCCRRELFLEVAELIHSHKIASIAASITNAEYEAIILREARHGFSLYGMCYLLVLEMNHKLAEGKYDGRIPFILDIGNPYADHIRQVHATALLVQKESRFLHAGGLYFDDDAEFGVLQAADIIAWGSRRVASGNPFPKGLEPVGEMLASERGHNEASWKAGWLRELSEGFLRIVAEMKATNEKEI